MLNLRFLGPTRPTSRGFDLSGRIFMNLKLKLSGHQQNDSSHLTEL